MAYDPISAQPTSGQNPWYTTMAAWMDSVETAIEQTDNGWEAHAGSLTAHVPGGGTAGQVLTKASGAAGDFAWATPTSGGTGDHGSLTGLSDADHPIAAVIGLQTALDGKSATGHTHSYEPVGTASAAITAHLAAGDPHPQYLTPAEAGAAYAPLAGAVPTDSGTAGQVLTKGAGTTFSWQSPSAGTVVAPVTLTASAVSMVPLTASGMAGQTGNIMEARLSDGNIYFGITSTGELRSGQNVATQNGQVRVGVTDPARQGLLIRLATAQTAKAIQVTDQSLSEKFSVSKDGFVIGQNIGAPVIVLDAVQAIPTTTLTGTVVLRRPA